MLYRSRVWGIGKISNFTKVTHLWVGRVRDVSLNPSYSKTCIFTFFSILSFLSDTPMAYHILHTSLSVHTKHIPKTRILFLDFLYMQHIKAFTKMILQLTVSSTDNNTEQLEVLYTDKWTYRWEWFGESGKQYLIKAKLCPFYKPEILLLSLGPVVMSVYVSFTKHA